MAKYAPLKVMTLAEVPPRQPGDRVFRPRRLDNVLALHVFAALALGALFYPTFIEDFGYAQEIPSWLAYVIGGVIALIAFIAYHAMKASLRDDSWLLRMAHNGLYLKVRSYLNYKLPADDPTVVFLPKPEIAALQAHRIKMRLTSTADDMTEDREPLGGRKYVEITLHDDDLTALTELIAAERARQRGPSRKDGMVAQHMPVAVLPGGVVQIDWAGISPGLGGTMRRLGQAYKVLEEKVTRSELSDESPSEDKERRLLELTERGEIIEAVKLAKALYGYDTTKAKAYVDELRR